MRIVARLAFFTAAISPAFTSISLTAQVISGSLVDDRSSAPIPNAFVALTDFSGTNHGVTTTNSEGRFRFEAPGPGIYQVSASRIGYATGRTEYIGLAVGQSENVELRLWDSPVILDSLRVIAENNGVTPGRVKFERRRALGKGYFLTGKDFEVAGYPPVEDLIRLLPDMTIDARGDVQSYASAGSGERGTTGCMRWVWNDFAVHENAGLMQTLEEMYSSEQGELGVGAQQVLNIIPATAVSGVEVYPSYRDVPQELRFLAWPPTGSSEATEPPCGLVVIWDDGGWGSGG